MRKLILVVTAASAFLAMSGNALAATKTVCPSGCDSTTIQGAIGLASNGDTITVVAGTYAEAVDVNKEVTLQGAQAGVDARTRSGPETIIDTTTVGGDTGLTIAANNVTVDGFTVQNSTSSNVFGPGVFIKPAQSGTHFVNNIVQDNIVGLFLANAPGGNQAVIQHDLFQDNNQPGSSSGQAIYLDQFTSGGPVSNVLIEANKFQDNANGGIAFSNTDNTNPDSKITVTNNQFDQNGRGMYFYSTNELAISGNLITNSTVPTDGGTSVGIAFFGDVNNAQVTGNTLQTGAQRGIRVGPFGGPFEEDPNSNIVIHENNISGFTEAGLFVDAGGEVGTLDATCNWWGSASGPANPSNPTGTGDPVIGNASFTPWLTGTAPAGACNGPISPCPAKPPSVNVRWHYSANGSSGSWSKTGEAKCGKTITLGPQAMEGKLKVNPGATVKAGYDFTLPGNKKPFTVSFTEGKVVFAVHCVSGKAPSEPTFTITLPNQSYSVNNANWNPSGDQSSPLVYQGAIAAPNLCGGGQLLLDQGGTFSAVMTIS